MMASRYRQLSRRLAALEAKIDGLVPQLLSSLETTSPARIAPGAASPAQPAAPDDVSPAVSQQLGRIQAVLQLLYDREPEMRERLRGLREEDTYRQAFEAPEPLVSVVIPTYDRGELLLGRAIPSVFAQSYTNIEVVVVGDCAPDDTGQRIADLGDPRVRYQNLSYRGPYPSEKRDLWHVAGIPPRNLGMVLARGSWIAPLDDDDAFFPTHVERLLELAKRERCEVAYGLLRCVMNDGSEFPLGAYPPELGQFGWQAALFHGGLRFFEMELADAVFSSPADWSLCRRMLRAGVRFGMLDEVVTDHYESRFSPTFEE